MEDKALELIKVEKLSKQYENDGVVTPVLNDISFVIKPGEFVSIMGPSGSGKSTLMHILGFLDKLTSGQYWFEGRDVSGLSDDELAAFRLTKVGFVFQQFNLLSKTTVLENVKLPLLYVPLEEEERISRAQEAIKAVGLDHRADYLSNKLSGGEKQRVAIARSLVNNPSLVFADEPTGNLDSKSGAQIMKILFDLNEDKGHTVILVTHEMYTANHAKRILRLKDGQLVDDEPVPESLRKKAIGGELK
ncbi:MAG: ABC transporter ATP-binding protein [Patescibacteria group bacterium]